MARRAALASRADLTAYRLVHGEGDGVPGLFVDRFDSVLVVHADASAVLDSWREPLRTTFRDFVAGYAKVHPPQASRAAAETERLWGPEIDHLDVVEHGMRFRIRPAEGLSVGLFLDMRDVRAWLRQAAAGKTLLNLFAYTCGFGVAAMLGDAARVVNLDLSRRYLEWGRENYALNGLPAEERDFIYGDAFDWLGRFERRSQRFDVVIADPPSFSSSRRGTFTVERDYRRLVELAARVVAPRGILLAATNHAGVSERRFDGWLEAGVQAAGRTGRAVRMWRAPEPDFPPPPGEASHLKVRAISLD